MVLKAISALLLTAIAVTEKAFVQGESSSSIQRINNSQEAVKVGVSPIANATEISLKIDQGSVHAHDANPGSQTVSAVSNYDGIISFNGTDPYNIVAESRSSSFSLPIKTQLFMCFLYGMLTFIAVTSNMIVCYIVLSNQRMRTATNYFIVNLAVGDILMALLCIPFTFPANLIFQYWPFGFTLCVLVSYSQANSVFISAYTMVAISIDKYLAIMYPMRLRMSKTQAKIIILVIWSAALLTSLPTALLSSIEPLLPDASNSTFETSSSPWPTSPLLVTQTLTTNTGAPASWLPPQPDSAQTSLQNQANKTASLIDDETKSTATSPSRQKQLDAELDQQPQLPQQGQRKYICQESWNFWPQGKYYYSMALMILQFVLPLFVLVITYSRIVIVVWGKRMPGEEDNARDARMARSKRKMIKMVIFCVIAFALTWLPFNALIVIGDVHPAIWENSNIMYIWFVTHYLAMCHTITNPLIYIWMNNRFRAGFGQVIEDLYMAAKLALVYLWFYCCCMGCFLRNSRVKQRETTSNLRQKRSQQIVSSSCLATNPATNLTPPNNGNQLINNHTANNPQREGVTVNNDRNCEDRIRGSRKLTSIISKQTTSKHRHVRKLSAQNDPQSGPITKQSNESNRCDRKEKSQKQRRKDHICLLTGRRRQDSSAKESTESYAEAVEKLEQTARRKRHKRAQSHAINLCLTSRQTQVGGPFCPFKQHISQVTDSVEKKQSCILKATGRPFITDICRSSQSTATLSIQTNTTSLAMSPMCSRRTTATNTNNNTSASSGEQATNLVNKSESKKCRYKARQKCGLRAGSSYKKVKEDDALRRVSSSDIRNCTLRYTDVNSTTAKNPSSLDSSDVNVSQARRWSHHLCYEHLDSMPSAMHIAHDSDNLETTDDDVADVVFQRTASLDSNNKQAGSMVSECLDQYSTDFYEDVESLEAEYGDSRQSCAELVPMVPLDRNHSPRAPGEELQGSGLDGNTKSAAPSQHRPTRLIKRLFSSMGEGSENRNINDRKLEVENCDECNKNKPKKDLCLADQHKFITKSAKRRNSNRDSCASHANQDNYQQLIRLDARRETIRSLSSQNSNSEQEQPFNPCLRTMLPTNHLILSTSRIPDHLAGANSLSEEAFPSNHEDVISPTWAKSTPSILKQSRRAFSGGNLPPVIHCQQGQSCNNHSIELRARSTTHTATEATPQPPRLARDIVDIWRAHEKSETTAASDYRDHQSSSTLEPAASIAPSLSLHDARDPPSAENRSTWLGPGKPGNSTGCFLRQERYAAQTTRKACSLDTSAERRKLIVSPDIANRSSSDRVVRSLKQSLRDGDSINDAGCRNDPEFKPQKSGCFNYERGTRIRRFPNTEGELEDNAQIIPDLTCKGHESNLRASPDSQIWRAVISGSQIVR